MLYLIKYIKILIYLIELKYDFELILFKLNLIQLI